MSSTSLSASSSEAPISGASPLVYPLDDFYAQAGRPLPAFEVISGDDMPLPYRSLLAHENDMTSTLAAFHGSVPHVRVLHRQQRDDFYFREVILVLAESGRRVEFGAIKINLGLLPAPVRRLLLEERLPLGQILQDHGLQFTSRPKAFLRMVADAFIGEALGVPAGAILYGRRNSLLDAHRRAFAEIVEILPPG